MPPKATEGQKVRMPQQHVRQGRGVPGYKGDVEVYPTARPASLDSDGGIESMRDERKSRSKPADKAKDSAEDK